MIRLVKETATLAEQCKAGENGFITGCDDRNCDQNRITCAEERAAFEAEFGFDPMLVAGNALGSLREIEELINSLNTSCDKEDQDVLFCGSANLHQLLKDSFKELCSLLDPNNPNADDPDLPLIDCRPHEHFVDRVEVIQSEFFTLLGQSVSECSSHDDVCEWLFDHLLPIATGIIVGALAASVAARIVPGGQLAVLGSIAVGNIAAEAIEEVVEEAIGILTEDGVEKIKQDICGTTGRVEELITRIREHKDFQDAIKGSVCGFAGTVLPQITETIRNGILPCDRYLHLIEKNLTDMIYDHNCSIKDLESLRQAIDEICPSHVASRTPDPNGSSGIY